MTRTAADLDGTALESVRSADPEATLTDTEVLGDRTNQVLSISNENDGRPSALRFPNTLGHIQLFNDLDRDYDLMERLRSTPIPTPEPVLCCEDESILVDAVYLTTHLDGDRSHGAPTCPNGLGTRNRERIGVRLLETLADIHSLPRSGRGCLRSRHAAGHDRAANRSARRGDQRGGTGGVEVPVDGGVAPSQLAIGPRDATPPWGVPAEKRPVRRAGSPRSQGRHGLVAALLGDLPIELEYFLLDWRDEVDPVLPLHDLEAQYSDEVMETVRAMNERGHGPFTAKPGSPTRRELVDRYEELTGIPVEDDRFFRAHAAFMLMTVWADLHRHQVEAGSAIGWGPSIDYIGLAAQAIIDGEYPR